MTTPPTPDEAGPDSSLKVEVRDSAISGQGIFARALIREGDVVLAWSPKVLTAEEVERLPANEREHYTYPEGNHVLWMQPPERYVNHSCEPNTHVVGRSDVALRDIHPGEEVTSDYVDLEAEGFVCNCGSKICRGKAKSEA